NWHDDMTNPKTGAMATKGCNIQDDGLLDLRAPIPLDMQDQMDRLGLNPAKSLFPTKFLFPHIQV
ncbi:hypothetical protein BGZ76_003382, partial [Entomortierella beljakovae]